MKESVKIILNESNDFLSIETIESVKTFPSQGIKMPKGKERASFKQWLGHYPGRTLHRIGAALGAIWLTSSAINLIWPLPDQISPENSLEELKKEDNSLPPSTTNR